LGGQATAGVCQTEWYTYMNLDLYRLTVISPTSVFRVVNEHLQGSIQDPVISRQNVWERIQKQLRPFSLATLVGKTPSKQASRSESRSKIQLDIAEE